MKLGVFVPNWIGDAAMFTPALRALRKHVGAKGELVGVVRPYVEDVLAGVPWFDRVIRYHPKADDRALRGSALLDRLRHEKLDAILLATNSLRSALIARLTGAPLRVGYVRYGRGWLLTHRLYHPRIGRRWMPTPAIDVYLQLAYALGCEWESPRLELATLASDERSADEAWNRLGLPSGDRVVVFNSGGAYGAAKAWPHEYFAALAQRIAGALGLSVLVNCGPAEQAAARKIVALAGHPRVVSLADERLSIGLSKACIRRSRLLVSTDSGPRFFAVAFGVPVVTLFGPTETRWSSTHDPHETCLQHPLPCGPCGKRVCPLAHHDCMRLLDVNRVYENVLRQMELRRHTHAA